MHLVPHSHDDAGWEKTVDEYYSGSQDMVRRAGVEYILDNVIYELEEDPKKTFTQVEVSFLERWWDTQTEEKKESVRRLVENGQLAFVGGGWVMEDEACTTYDGIITNMQRGHEFLKREFNYTVKTAW